jgi:hypothetical protein
MWVIFGACAVLNDVRLPQRMGIPGRASCPKNANPAARRSGLQVELRDIQTALATLREASGNGPCNDLGIIAGEPFERRQCAHDLTCAYQVHLCNNGRFDRHFDSSRTQNGSILPRPGGRHAFAQPKRHFLRANCITHVSPPPFAPTIGAPACRRAARSPPPHPAQDPPGSVPRSAARRSVDPGAAIRGRPRRVGPAR